ncbi:MAG: hypothetical protein HOV68_03640 [Streptomycetaceae bacterium]|nr:hypothetical protein [Streptomycetaceae bacterium]
MRSNTPANVTINGRVAHPTTVTSGAKMSLEAPAVATDGVATFKAWAQGGDRTFTMTMPDRDTVLDVAYETPIDKRYDSDEAFRKLLGAPIGEELGADVRFREFQNGRAYWSKDAGVHSIGGAILQNYLDQGGSPAFGPPVTDEMVAADGVGRYSTFGFESASYWSPQTGAHVVHGQNFLKWQASGLEQGPLGYPTTDEGDTGRPGGRYNDFQNGTVVWSPGTGSHLVTGEIYKKYAQYNWDWGVLGFPTTDEGDTGRPGGRYNNFQNGTVIWSPGTGAHLVTGAILAKYGAQGWDQGSLAFPTTDELDTGRPGGRFNNFQGGTIIWSAQTGAQQVQGAILQKYGEYGWDGGRLAFPTTSEVALRNGAYTHFQGGSVYWSAPTGAHALFGAIKDRWAARGWENSYLGYPTSEEFAVPGGVRQNFQGGYVVWTASTGAVTDQRY